MDPLYYLSSDIVAALVLALLLWAIRQKSGRGMEDQRMFCGMLTVNLLLLVFDLPTRIFDGLHFPGAGALIISTNLICYLLNPFVSFYFARYCEIKLELPPERRRRHTAVYTAAVALHSVLALLSLWRPVFFGVVDNTYVRGPLFIVSYALSYLPTLFAFFEALKKRMERHGGSHRVENVLMLYLVPPVIGAAVQLFLPEAMIIWVSTMFSMLILFINLQNSQITTDTLTGLNNRGRLHSYLDWKIRHPREGCGLYLVMLDIDNFKQVNDRFGHLVGDEALHAAVGCLRAAAQPGDFMARYGGDEFVILAERHGEDEIEALMARVDSATAAFNAAGRAPYELSFSMGCSRWTPGETGTDAFISRADARMYEKKAARTPAT